MTHDSPEILAAKAKVEQAMADLITASEDYAALLERHADERTAAKRVRSRAITAAFDAQHGLTELEQGATS